MQKTEKLLDEKLLKLGNPKFWGENYFIKLLGGETFQGTLVRVNWTMKYGKMIGHLLLKNNGSERTVDLDKIIDILLETATGSTKSNTRQDLQPVPIKFDTTTVSQAERKAELVTVV